MKLRHSTLVLFVALTVIYTAGCQGFLADRKISQVEDTIDKLQPLNPTQHAQQEWEGVQAELAQVKAQKQSDPSAANTRATDLVTRAEALEQAVLVAEANSLQSKAQNDIEIMNLNDGRNINPTRYDEINAQFGEATAAKQESKWEQAIRLSSEVSQAVDQILVEPKQQANRLLTELQNDRQEMTQYEADIYAPEIVASVDQYIETVNRQIDEERNFLAAQESARRGKREVQDGITKANTIRSQIRISQLEERLEKAVEEGAELHAPSQFKNAVKTFDNVLQDFINDEFDKVLQTIEILRPNVDQLIFVTLTNSTDEKIGRLNQEIARHREGGAENYLKARLDLLVQKVKEAEADFNVTSEDPAQYTVRPAEEKLQIEESFANIKQQIQEAFILSDKIDAAFDDLTGSAIRDAEFALGVAGELYAKTQGAFLKPTPADVTPLDPDFTYGKNALLSELGQRQQNSEALLRQAKNDRSEGSYQKGIQTAQQVERTANYIQEQVYRVVADNAILELENQITRFTNEGAAEFAANDLEKTRITLNEAKNLLNQGQYREASEQASRVRSQLDVTLQVLGRATLDKIAVAQAAIADAEALKAPQFAPETLGRARSLVADAQTALEARSYRAAIQTAELANNVATDAQDEAGLAWSRQELEESRDEEQLAEAAGAVSYAPLLLRRAQNQLATAKEFRKKGLYLEASVAAQEATRSFQAATFKKINEANEAILTSRRSEGWKYESSELTKAIVKAEEAQDALEAGQFKESLKLAEQSRAIAEEITEAAQQAGVNERLSRIQAALREAERSGANYFQVSEVKRLLGETERVKATARQRTYDDLIEELDRIEAEFQIVNDSTDDRLDQLVQQQLAKVEMLENETRAKEVAAESLSSAKLALNYSLIDFDEGNYPSSYNNLRSALDEIAVVETALLEQEYQIELTALFRELSDALSNFDAVISAGPAVLKRNSLGIQGRGQALAIANSYSPAQFKQRVDDIYAQILAMEFPESRKNLHNEAVKAVREARLAGAEFQKFLIFDELDRDSVYQTIDTAYYHLDKMDKLRSGVQQRLLNAGADLDRVPLRRARDREGILLQSYNN